MWEFVKIAIESGVGRLTLSRPDKRNALKREFIEEIRQGIDELQADPGLRVFLLESEGSVFCAGMDLAEMQQRYRQTPPAISMDTIPEGPWRQRLELLREEMISEVESGLSHTVFRKGGYGSTG